jgi:hypothetical protein
MKRCRQRLAEPTPQRPSIRRRRIQFNGRIELTRRVICLLGGAAFGQDVAMQRLFTSPAVHLMRDVRPLEEEW